MVKDHKDSKRGNLLLPHGLLFPINSNDSFICTIQQTGYFGLCYIRALVGMKNSPRVHHEGSILQPIAPWADALPWFIEECQSSQNWFYIWLSPASYNLYTKMKLTIYTKCLKVIMQQYWYNVLLLATSLLAQDSVLVV